MKLWSMLFGTSRSKGSDPEVQRLPSPSLPIIQWKPNSFPMKVVGESNYQAALVAICGRHTRHGYEGEHKAFLVREPTNAHDKNAVLVRIEHRKIGYLGRDQALRVGQQMAAAGLYEVACKARIRGGWRTNQYDEGHFGVSLAVPNSGWIDFGIGGERPTPEPTVRQRRGHKIKSSDTGPMAGQRVFILGAQSSEAVAQELAAAGATIMATIGKSTTLMVVNAPHPFAVGVRRSANFRKAQEANLKVVSIDEVRADIKRLVKESA